MKHLVIGASGQVGHALIKALTEAGHAVGGTYLSHPQPGMVMLNMTDRDAVEAAFANEAPDAVWIPGAMPDVDRCEREPEFSYQVNVEGPKNVMAVARRANIPLVYFSTDYVFDGFDGPYRENDAVHPLQVYGQHKVEAEQALLAYGQTLVVRPAWIYSDEPNPRNFVYRVLSDLKAGKPIKSAADQINTPTPAGPLARHALQALLDGHRGVLHLAGPERLTRLAFVERIAQMAGFPTRTIESISVADLPLPAKRPLNGGLISNHPTYAIQDRLEDLDLSPLLTAP
ncbi:SDR family oxidoreductase [Sulfobacillus harzensis]|uniref:dTDP-4-dehydrorhamnose reductase n=1 Tax=Sulfobacillus harzensis TaxID=2729629 RepID=A0A7Y0L124_9FIRM|nr:SDR family oxidoreductase [Sulfobacillus harzensis]NMP21351.1 SDR family oxidoreductase [Sulfobacillus harzensis]